MDEKQNDIFTIAVIAGILMAFVTFDLLYWFGVFTDKPVLDTIRKPILTTRGVANGTFFEDYEAYVKARFYNGTKWEKTVRSAEFFFGKREYNEVYVGKKATLFERHLTEEYEGTPVEKSLDYLEELVTRYHANVILVPTSDSIWRDRLPLYADVFQQEKYLTQAKERIGDEYYIGLYDILTAHAKEKLYYEADPHWTSLAAYYAYEEWWRHTGERVYYSYDLANKKVVTEGFVGPLIQRSGSELRKESIFILEETLKKPVQVTYDNQVMLKDFYRPEYLNTENAYGYFLGDGFGFAQIDTGRDQTKTLFVIGDSYANCMIPLLAPYYKTIYLYQSKDYKGDAEKLFSEYCKDNTDVLVLESVTGLLDQFR
ncbi:MAG: hypothetical protein J6X14_01310 [Lachnospiraceae bacterium]|nr:hypothetical protein [Lachnospiraceae bacterium]MBP5668930.1 hypothetical protein [Lachnospiraceae bacterium]